MEKMKNVYYWLTFSENIFGKGANTTAFKIPDRMCFFN